ncbi:fam-a protein [Plasmodium vinckei lentum]|uniref:Fam-a protein n=1 Tax=Plasmodium vinckei lentum TaxID=138297 RepID=A0A6V7RW10_PLAVN|nr:fam-a protein [Plasmodium vinckei lentum]
MNKGYIKTVFFVLSLVVCASNNALASEPAAKVTNSAKTIGQKKTALDPKREEYKHMLCKDPEETEMAAKQANEIATLLLKLSETSLDGYSVDIKCENGILHSKKFEKANIKRYDATIQCLDKCDGVVNKLWDFEDPQKFINKIIIGSLVRVYNPNLILFEKFNANGEHLRSKKRYAIGARIKVSDDITVVVFPSRSLNYLNDSDKEVNTKEMLKNAKSIETDIDAEEAFMKLGATISGFIIKKGNHDEVHLTYINAAYDDGHAIGCFNDKRDEAFISKIITCLMLQIFSSKQQCTPSKSLSTL